MKAVEIVDQVIHENDPISLIRAFRHYIIKIGKENKNELGIMKNVIKENNKRDNNIKERTNILKVNDPLTLTENNIQGDGFKNIKIFNKISKSAEYQRLISESSNSFYEHINEEYHNKFISEDKLDNIDLLRFKIQNNYYFSKKLLLEEIDNLFINIRKKFDIQINNGTRATYKNKGTRGRRRKLTNDINGTNSNGKSKNGTNGTSLVNNNINILNSINGIAYNGCINENSINNNSMVIEDEKKVDTNTNQEENKYDVDGFIIPIQNYKYKELYIIYLNTIYIRLVQLIQQLNFDELFEADVRLMINNNKLPKSNMSISSLPIHKDFEIISDYHHIKPEETEKVLVTSITPSCEGGCCNEINQLGPFSLDNSKWNCCCKDRSNNIECDPNICKCDINICKNLSLYKKEYKIINIDVEERYSWGIDLYTYRNLLYIFPENFDNDSQYYKDFIEKTLILVINKLGNKGNKLTNACYYIINNSSLYSNIDYCLAKHLLNLFQSSKICDQLFNNAYCKGIGIFCKKKEGIKQNELIAPYLGEIYSPYLWYEKQDLIKAKKMDKNLPDFYNIMLERMKNDPDGYNLIMIDPNSKGNFASRMSHSCVPNCNTVLMVSNKKYSIGMYAMRDIQYDEELTFDYNSITENQKEYQMAICLCSSYLCRGHYLILSNSMIFTEIINKFHTFLHRNIILLKASYMGEEPLKEEELMLLKKYSIGNSLLNSCPIWLQRWTSLTIYFIDLERQLLPIILYKAEEREREMNKKSMMKIKNKNKKKKLDLKINEKNNSKDCKNKIKKKLNGKNSENTPTRKKRSSSTKAFTINKYNFNSDFVWYQKSYKSKTRPNNIIDKAKEESNFDKIYKRSKTKSKPKKEKDGIKKHKNSNSGSKKNFATPAKGDSEKKNFIFGNALGDSLRKLIENNENDIDFINICNKYNFKEEELKMIDIETDPSFDFLSEQNLKLDKEFDKILYEGCKYQVSGIIDQRIQSLSITLDKIKHVLSLIGSPYNTEPPLRFLTEKEKYECHWKPMKEYLRENFIKLREKINSQNVFLMEKYQKIIISLSPPIFVAGELNYKNLNIESRETLLKISKILYEISLTENEVKLLDYKGLADILSLYANTKVHFTTNKNINGCFYGENIQILKRDVDSSCVPNEFLSSALDTVIAEGKKEYENNYIWGQLVGWYKQTVDKPNASLSAERKGALCYPDIESFFWNDYLTNNNKTNYSESINSNNSSSKKENNNSEYNYPYGGRIQFFEKLKDNISMSWPTTNQWSFKNRNKIYGTVQLDSVIYGNFYLNKIDDYYSFIINQLISNDPHQIQ